MKRTLQVLLLLITLGFVGSAMAVDFAVHGDMNNRALIYTNHNDWLDPDQQGKISDGTVKDEYAELKYRFWFEAASNDQNLKGVYAIEIGGIRFGRSGSGKGQGGSFSGDGVNLETRWAYTDFQIPAVERSARFRVGLMPVKVNSYLWQETAAGVNFSSDVWDIDYQLAWIRGYEDLARDRDTDDIRDLDFFHGRLNPELMDDLDTGFFVLYGTGDATDPQDLSNDFPGVPPGVGRVTPRDYQIKVIGDTIESDFWTIGLDGGYKFGDFFLKWDLMYQSGDLENIFFDDSEFSGSTRVDDFDLSAYLAHLDFGMNLRQAKLTYSFWYASGDDDPDDSDFDAFIAIDLDRDDSIALFEGLYSDDVTYFTERPYVLDKGFVMNKLALDYQFTDKFKAGCALLYMLTAEDIEYTDFNGRSQADDTIGFEIDGYFTYMLYKNLELSVNAGYLFADDALDAFEEGDLRDGSSDENIFGSSMRLRYKF